MSWYLIPREFRITADSPVEAAAIVEIAIQEKQPKNVIFSYSFDNLLDLYEDHPDVMDVLSSLFRDFPVIPVSSISVGDYARCLQDFTIPHLVLYDCVALLGHPTPNNEEKGICYTAESIKGMAKNPALLFFVLHDILSKERAWSERAPGKG